MPTNYTANPSGVHAPSSAPGPGVLPIVQVPLDGEAANAASVTQAPETLADFAGYLIQRPGAINSDGFDGVITLDGVVAAPTGMTKVGTVYTMTRDIFPSTLTVTGAGVVLYTANFRIIGSGDVITIGGGNISNDGPTGAATSTSTTTATTAGSLGAGSNGGGGGAPAGSGVAGSNVASNGLGAVGGTGGLGTGGTGGTVAAPAGVNYHGWPGPNSSGYIFGTGSTGTWSQLQGGSGGGGGGGGGATNGGAGGAGGGVMVIAARRFVLANATDIHCKGGVGGAVSVAGGGGGGGGGGLMILVYGACNQTMTAANCVAGGAGGSGGGGGSAGAAGSNGTLLQFNQG